MAEHRLMNNSKDEKAINAMNLLTIQPGGLAPTIGSPSTKGTRSSRYTQLAVEVERLKFENKALKSRVQHLETIFDKKKGKTEMDKNINLLSNLLYDIKLAKRESSIDKKLGKNKLKGEVTRLYNLLKQAKDDCLSKMDQLVQADIRFEKERAARYKTLDELTNDRKTFVALLRADRKRYITTLQRVQDGGEQIIINEKLIFGGENPADNFNGKKHKHRRNYNRKSYGKNKRPNSSGRRRRGNGGRNQNTTGTRMRNKKHPARPHTAGKLSNGTRPMSAGKHNRPKSGPSRRPSKKHVIQPLITTENNPTSNDNNNNDMNSQTQNNIVQSYQVPESPSNQVAEEIIASSGEMAFPIEPKPPKRPVRVGPKERAGGIRRRVISGPNKLIKKESDKDDATIISPEKQIEIEKASKKEIQAEIKIEDDENEEDEDEESINTEETGSDHAIKMPSMGVDDVTSSEEDDNDDDDEEEEETDDDEDSESADISNKLELLSGKGNGETRNALPPLNTNNRRGSRERRKPSENSNENANAPKIFPMTP